MVLILLLLFVNTLAASNELWWCQMKNGGWCRDIDYESPTPFWLVVYKTYEKDYNSKFRYLMWCGDGTDDCNVPMHWKYETRMFQTHKGAIEWINMEFSKSPERVVSIREVGKPQQLKSKVTEKQEVITTKTTEWVEKWENETNF